MKGSRKFIFLFSFVFVLYVIAELNKPKAIDWTVTLSNNDKIPYGGYILFNRLKDIFPATTITPQRDPIYNRLNNSEEEQSGYLIISPNFKPSANDVDELRLYVQQGNHVFIASGGFSKPFLDTFRLKTDTRFSVLSKDSTSVNLVNPQLKSKENFTFLSNTIDDYFSAVDTAFTTILGTNDRGQPNFIKVSYGEGSFYFHTAPLCFSNYFLLHQNNAEYTAKALSYMPNMLTNIYWDEYYKPGGYAPVTPLRFILSHASLLWALRLALAGLLIYVLFEMKRKQRIIPVITPLANSSLDFVKTVSNVYFNQKDNAGIAEKKISYFFEFIRNRFYLQTSEINRDFVEILSRKSGVDRIEIERLVSLINEANNSHEVSDSLLITLDKHIDNFYNQV